MAESDERGPLLSEIFRGAVALQKGRVELEEAKRKLVSVEDGFLDAVHRARCQGLPWRPIVFRTTRGQGFGDASVVEQRLRKRLHRFRRQTGRPPCPERRLVWRRTTHEF